MKGNWCIDSVPLRMLFVLAFWNEVEGLFVSKTQAQGLIHFANRSPGIFDAPIFLEGETGPGNGWTAEIGLLFGEAIVVLSPRTSFYASDDEAPPHGTRYLRPVTVEVPTVAPGSQASFIVRVYPASWSEYQGGLGTAQSAPFSVTVGGGDRPHGLLTTFPSITIIPELPVSVIGVIGATLLFLGRRCYTVN